MVLDTVEAGLQIRMEMMGDKEILTAVSIQQFQMIINWNRCKTLKENSKYLAELKLLFWLGCVIEIFIIKKKKNSKN